jgi:hypothetical protein
MTAKGFVQRAVFRWGGQGSGKHGLEQGEAEAGAKATEDEASVEEFVAERVHGLIW